MDHSIRGMVGWLAWNLGNKVHFFQVLFRTPSTQIQHAVLCFFFTTFQNINVDVGMFSVPRNRKLDKLQTAHHEPKNTTDPEIPTARPVGRR